MVLGILYLLVQMMSQQKIQIQSGLFFHTGMYVTAIGLLIPAGLGLFCCYFFWC